MQVKTTRDYNLFKRLPGNREVRKLHIQRLQESIEADATLSKYKPILVNDRYQIIDGQHRFEAMKNLGLDLYYVIAPKAGLDEVQTLNSIAKVWTPLDYAVSYSDLNKEPYKFYLQMRQAFKLNHDILRSYIALDEPMTAHMYQSGLLVAPDPQKSWDLATKLSEVGEYCDQYRLSAFAGAFKAIATTEGYDHARMLAKLKLRAKFLPPRSLKEDFIRELEKIYNWHSPAGQRLRFDFN